jgi:hypothetical protein
MVATPNDLFSWNNKYSKYTSYYRNYVHEYSSLSVFQLCTSLTLCMLAFWSCEGVVFLVHSPSSHFTADHVLPLPLSGVNWRSLSLLWGSGPPLPKMAALSTGSAHTPFSGSNTLNMLFGFKNKSSTFSIRTDAWHFLFCSVYIIFNNKVLIYFFQNVLSQISLNLFLWRITAVLKPCGS